MIIRAMSVVMVMLDVYFGRESLDTGGSASRVSC